MKKLSLKPLSCRFLPALAAVATAGVLGTTGVSAQQFVNNFGDGINTDPESPWFGGGDHLWSNPANWNAPIPDGNVAWINVSAAHQTTEGKVGGPATIDYAAPNIAELVIGQGGGDGHVRMTTGGSMTMNAVNMAWGTDRSGILDVDNGIMNAGELRLGRGPGGIEAIVNVSGGTLNATAIQLSSRTDEGGPAGANSFLNVSGGTVNASGNLEVGHLGGDASVLITGGTVNVSQALVANLITSTANGSLTITGGTLNALQIGVGASGGTAVGHLTIGGDATVTTTNHIFLRPEGRGVFTVNGSNATININRVGSTGFEVTAGSILNFNADAGGFSTVNIATSTMRFSANSAEIYIDASDLGIGVYDLFTFASYFSGTHNDLSNRFGIVDITFGTGLSGDLLYNANSIQLEVIPEPSTYAAIFGALALLGVMIRRRMRK